MNTTSLESKKLTLPVQQKLQNKCFILIGLVYNHTDFQFPSSQELPSRATLANWIII